MSKKNLNYDINIAIDIRGKKYSEVGFDIRDNHPDVLESIIDFKDSIMLAREDSFAWGYWYWQIDQIGINKERTMTKEQYKKTYSSYRKFQRDLYNGRDMMEYAL